MAVDGVQPDIAENVRESGFEADEAQLKANIEDWRRAAMQSLPEVQKVGEF